MNRGATTERSTDYVAFATKHGKEQQFAPSLGRVLGVEVAVADLDTDQLGTFTGEVPRPSGQLDTARQKARWALNHTGARYGLSSEGSFGPHPQIPFVAGGLELAVFIDRDEDLEIAERLWCSDTNFSHLTISEASIPAAFLDRVGFPSHAVIVSPERDGGPYVKGIQDAVELADAIAAIIAVSGAAVIQTDMRAHLNPTRQRCLEQLAERLAARLLERCPRCDARGWGIVDVSVGLPCQWCGSATDKIAADHFACTRSGCGHQEQLARVELASPADCPRCNP